MPEVEFTRWETPFEKGDIEILQASFGNGGGYVGYPKEKLLYEFDPTNQQPWGSLAIRLFHKETRAIYRVLFRKVGAFRMLDEDSLLELWEKRSDPNLGWTFQVRNHAWSNESMLAFLNHTKDGWSWLISSENWCIEILSLTEPEIEIETHACPRNVPNDTFDPLNIDDEIIGEVLKGGVLYRQSGEKV